MYVTIEGVSKSGKTTIIDAIKDKLINDGYNVVVFKGNGQINHHDWRTYNIYMHMMMKRLDELNNDTIILHDRGFSEYIITNDIDLERRYHCHKNAKVILLRADTDSLIKRGSYGGDEAKIAVMQHLCDKRTKQFNRKIIDTGVAAPEQAAESAIEFILDE